MLPILRHGKKYILSSGCLVVFLLFLVGCGGSSASGSSSSTAMNAPAHMANSQAASGNAQGATSSSAGAQVPDTTKQQGTPIGPQYLIKTLKVSMDVKDTRKVASIIQAWVASIDVDSSTAGADYEQTGDNLYNVSLNFSVRASVYPQIYNYLRDYAPKEGGQLQSFTETVQDVTNDYVDTQSRLKNLRVEQQRVQDLLSHAQALKDVLTIEQKLTDVEGQIESIEAHLNELSSQVAYYTVSVSLQPIETAPPPPPPSGWSAGQAFHDAFAASLAFAQSIANFLIWLLAFSFYLVPAALIIWFVWRVRNNPRRATPKPAETPTPTSSDI
ncbi:MAG: DUF4349 domain-containing protein [Chloroflexota bacterium]|nr:DUF4349 domain-containing protein [Chloroflexota bacterium]